MLMDNLYTNRERHRPIRPYLGVLRPDNTYNAVSGVNIITVKPGLLLLQPEVRLAKHREACADRTSPSVVTIPDYMGFEIIRDYDRGSSITEFPYGLTKRLRSRLSHRFKPVWHYKSGFKCLPFLKLYRDYRGGTTAYFEPAWRYGLNTNYSVSAASRMTAEPDRDLMFSARAYWNMRPRFAQGIQLLNSIFELKDYRDVFSLLPRLKRLCVTPQGLRRLGTLADEVKARDLTGAAANAWLMKQLAIDPTIRDVLAIWAQALKDVDDHLAEFCEYGKNGSVSHYSEWDRNRALVLGTKNYVTVGDGWDVTELRTATARYWYDYDIPSRNRLIREYWGLTGTVESFWNMIPMSFVLDYFLTIGKSLAAMERDNYVHLVDMEYCESHVTTSSQGRYIVDHSTLLGLIIDNEPRNITGSGNAHLVTGHEVKRYIRLPCTPYAGPALPRLKLPSRTQAYTLAALARVLLI